MTLSFIKINTSQCANASKDLNDGDNDPMPRATHNDENKHGTRCAGEVASRRAESTCGVGIAYNAGIGGKLSIQ